MAVDLPSSAFNKPERLKVDPSSLEEELLDDFVVDEVLVIGDPVEVESRETPLVNAASRSELIN